MLPRIAVDVSPRLGRIIRGFFFVSARRWRLLWYTIVAIVYGAFTFLFVRLFIFLTLPFTHKFVGLWVVRPTDGEQPLWGSLCPGSSLWRLPYHADYMSLSSSQAFAAMLIMT